MQTKLDFSYKTSRDYHKLFELVKTHRVICIVTYKSNILNDKSIELKDICVSGVLAEDDQINIGCRGTSFITAFAFDGNSLKEEFLKQCEHYRLEYIDPDT